MGKVLVSLTTTFHRQHLVRPTLASLQAQTAPPAAIYVNVSTEPYLQDRGFGSVPDFLTDPALSVAWVPNTGSYRKLLPTLERAEATDIVVTADDDVVYARDWLARLVEAAEAAPHAIVAARARVMTRNAWGGWTNYRLWPNADLPMAGHGLLPIGVGGVVYRKDLLDLPWLFDPRFASLAPTTDDIWFRAASLRRSTPVVVDPALGRGSVYLDHDLGLERTNTADPSLGDAAVTRARRLVHRFMDYAGINRTANDVAWDAVRGVLGPLPSMGADVLPAAWARLAPTPDAPGAAATPPPSDGSSSP
jgi:hypothetical protein